MSSLANAAQRARPVLVELLWVLSGLLAAWVVLGLLIASGVLPDPSKRGLGLLYGPVAAAVAAAVYWYATQRGEGANDSSGRVGVGATWAWLGLHVLAAIGGSMALAQLLELLGVPVSEQKTVQEIAEAARGGPITTDVIFLGISAIAAAPLSEEWLFRGLLFHRLKPIAGLRPAYVISALAFAAIHTNPAGLIIYFWLGLVFASAYQQTGRLWGAMLVHLANNAVAMTLLLYGPSP